MQRPIIRWLALILLAAVIGFVCGYSLHAWFTSISLGRSIAESESLPHEPNLYLPIYQLEPNEMVEDTCVYVAIPVQRDLSGRLAVLAQRLSHLRFGDLPIDILAIELREGTRIARIDLRESPDSTIGMTWRHHYFQGSTGGAVTAYTLTRTFLQPRYKGDWVEGVEFYYEGKPFGNAWDHVFLGGTIMRTSIVH